MPRKNELAEREKAICMRILEFRKHTSLSRVAFARHVGMDSILLASYEHGRSQLNYHAAWKILSGFPDLNPAWLANGPFHIMRGGVRGMLPLPDESNIGPRTPFSFIFDTIIEPSILAASSGLITQGNFYPMIRDVFSQDANGRNCAIAAATGLAESVFESVPNAMINQLFGVIRDAAHHAIQDYPSLSSEEVKKIRSEIQKIRASQLNNVAKGQNQKIKSKPTVDINGNSVILTPMLAGKSHLETLLDRVKRATKTPGSKAQLARDFGVSRQAVNKWLKGSAPSAELTLRLLEWVQAEEANQQKSPGSASTPPERKTQLGRSSHEPQKSDPKAS